jgi:2-phospho-L-lactate guanylyltransferase
VRSFEHGKSRLATVLGSSERARYTRALFDNVVAAARNSRTIDHVLIASDAPIVDGGHDLVPDVPGSTLAQIVDAAVRQATESGADRAVVLMSDLPLITAADIDELVEQCAGDPLVVVPDHRELGTNALVLSLPTHYATCFGNDDSFERHRALEGCAVHRNPRIARDVDTPEDYREASALARSLEHEPAAQ